MTRKTKADWIINGAELLQEAGAQALTVDALLKRMEMTKGSFYHHFRGLDDYIAQFLTYFEQEGTQNIIERVNEAPTPQARLHRLIDIVTRYPAELEPAMRVWALRDERVRAIFERIDAQRIAYVEALFRPIVDNPALAHTLSRTLYAILVGSEHIMPPASNNEQRAMFDAFLDPYGIEKVGPIKHPDTEDDMSSVTFSLLEVYYESDDYSTTSSADGER